MISALPSEGPRKVTRIRDTAAQDQPVDQAPRIARRRYLIAAAAAGALLLVVAIGLLAQRWLSAQISMPRERVRIEKVQRGTFVREVAAQGTVVAAVSPTLFAPATGTVHFLVQAGDEVKKSQVLATLESPELSNELQRERATL